MLNLKKSRAPREKKAKYFGIHGNFLSPEIPKLKACSQVICKIKFSKSRSNAKFKVIVIGTHGSHMSWNNHVEYKSSSNHCCKVFSKARVLKLSSRSQGNK